MAIARADAYPGDFPDPCLIHVGEAYYAFATNSGPINIQVMTSTDPTGSWHYLGDALPAIPTWAQSGFTWAPAVQQRDDQFLLYYTVREPVSGRQGISLATSSTPQGPYVDHSDGPLILQLDHGGSIDPCPFVDADGTLYLLWKSDDNAINRPAAIWAQQLDATGGALVGTPTKVLSYDRRWEDPLIEAPALVMSDGQYFLFYSGNWWESDRYAIGYAKAGGPLGPFSKITTTGPWKGSSGGEAGPGGQDFCPHPAGGYWMVYHAWQPGRVGYANGGVRTLRVTTVQLVAGAPQEPQEP